MRRFNDFMSSVGKRKHNISGVDNSIEMKLDFRFLFLSYLVKTTSLLVHYLLGISMKYKLRTLKLHFKYHFMVFKEQTIALLGNK